MALEGVEDACLISLFISALHDSSSFVRCSAVDALAVFKTDDALIALLQAADDPDDTVRMKLSRALGTFADMRTYPTLVALLADANKGVRHGAAHSLSLLGEPVFEKLLGLLKDDNPDVRIGAASALGYMRDARALPALVEMQEHDNGVTPTGARVTTAVGKAIRRITEKTEAEE